MGISSRHPYLARSAFSSTMALAAASSSSSLGIGTSVIGEGVVGIFCERTPSKRGKMGCSSEKQPNLVVQVWTPPVASKHLGRLQKHRIIVDVSESVFIISEFIMLSASTRKKNRKKSRRLSTQNTHLYAI